MFNEMISKKEIDDIAQRINENQTKLVSLDEQRNYLAFITKEIVSIVKSYPLTKGELILILDAVRDIILN